MKKNFFRSRPKISFFATAGIVLAVIGALVALASGMGHRFGLWPFGLGFSMLRWGGYIAIGAAVITLVGMVAARPRSAKGGLPRAFLGLCIALTIIAVPAFQLQKARALPPIHDITTDIQNPPQFVSILPLRADAPNGVEYAGEAVAQQQRQAYPDIKPLLFPASPESAFKAASTAARQMGWEIVAEDKENGRIEATATTFWFGFKDDVVIRVTPQQEGSQIDIRSVSRVGLSDVGANAQRIREFMGLLNEATGGKSSM